METDHAKPPWTALILFSLTALSLVLLLHWSVGNTWFPLAFVVHVGVLMETGRRMWAYDYTGG